MTTSSIVNENNDDDNLGCNNNGHMETLHDIVGESISIRQRETEGRERDREIERRKCSITMIIIAEKHLFT